MKHLFFSIYIILVSNFSIAQTNFNWSKNIDLPYTDINGNALTGTEIIHLVPHKGKLYAGNSYWAENTDPRRGQVWVKETYNSEWKRDYQMPVKSSRVPSLYSFTFKTDLNANSIKPDTILFAGATFDKGSNNNGPAVVYMRDNKNNSWLAHNLGFTDHAFAYTQIRSMGFHKDKITGVDIVFAGANPAPTGVYAGRYNESEIGKIKWDEKPEFTPSGFQRIMGFAVCNDTLYMATQREVYKRIDGINPPQRWVQILNLATPSIISTYGTGLDTYWLNDEDIRGFRSIKNPNGGNKDVLIFGALNHIFRIHPEANYQLIPEKDIEEVIELATGHDFHYLQTQQISDYTDPLTNQTVQLIGFEGFYEPSYLEKNPQPNVGGFNKQGYYFERRQNGSNIDYQLKEIIDYSITDQPDALARVRTIQVSPFPEDENKVIYAGGFAPWFLENSGGVTKTAWIYKGTLQNSPVAGFTQYSDINYTTGLPQSQLNLNVYVPKGGQAKKPVMIYVHGGSWRTGDKKNTGFKDEFFTNNDYIFISINYRLSPDPINLSDGNRILFPDHPTDVAKAIKWVFQNIGSYGGDINKVSLIGHSSGAHLVSLIATDQSYLNKEGLQLNQIRCVCSLDAGGYDIPYYLNKYESPNSSQWNNYVNAFGSNQNDWAKASPINHLAPNKGIPAFMLVHQGNTQRIELATQFGNALAKNEISKTLLNASPLDHEGINGVLGSANQQAQKYNDAVNNFFTNCLKNTTVSTTSLSERNDEIKIYPNPTKGELNIGLDSGYDISNIQIEISSITGSIIENFKPNTHHIILDTSKYLPGIYFVNVKTENGKIVKKIIKI
jgi:arylformamidase